MSLNPYAPPQAEVTDLGTVSTGPVNSPAFFPVSKTKLLVLSICSLGMYQYYWFYRNWKIIRERTGEDLSPFWRAFFAIFFIHSLFKRVKSHSAVPLTSGLAAGELATVWVVLTLLYRLPDPYWLVAFLAIWALLPVQAEINAINASESPGHDPNTRFSGWNWLMVALGGPFFLMAVYGTFMPAATR